MVLQAIYNNCIWKLCGNFWCPGVIYACVYSYWNYYKCNRTRRIIFHFHASSRRESLASAFSIWKPSVCYKSKSQQIVLNNFTPSFGQPRSQGFLSVLFLPRERGYVLDSSSQRSVIAGVPQGCPIPKREWTGNLSIPENVPMMSAYENPPLQTLWITTFKVNFHSHA